MLKKQDASPSNIHRFRIFGKTQLRDQNSKCPTYYIKVLFRSIKNE